MDLEDFRLVLTNSGVDLWTLIDTAISVATREHGKELKERRDGIVERLYAVGTVNRCQNCDQDDGSVKPLGAEIGRRETIRSGGPEADVVSPEGKGLGSPLTPQSMVREEGGEEEGEEEEEEDRRSYGRPIDAEQRKILSIKDRLEDPDQSEDSLVHLLQNLADMDITFKALKETDIGRHVNGLRKHTSNEVRRLVKQLVRKWKDLVDDWVKSNSTCETASPAVITDGDSPQQIPGKSSQNGNQVLDFGYSPIPHNGSLGSDRNNLEVESKAKVIPNPRREAPAKQQNHSTPSSATPARIKEQKDNLIDPERFASARKRLHENYQEAENAKKQRTIQVMDIHEIPKPKNSFLARNKGGFQAKHW